MDDHAGPRPPNARRRSGARCAPAPRGDAAPIRVLLVDPLGLEVVALRRVIADAPGLELVGTASRAADAVALAGRLRPDVVVVDRHLADGDGIACACALKDGTHPPRVLVLTGERDDEDLVRAVRERCDGLIPKSGSAADLVAGIRRAHAGEAAFADADLIRVMVRVRAQVMPSPLTAREREVLGCLADGRSTAEVAAQLFIGVLTVRSHVRRILEKLGAHSKLEAVAIARRDHLLGTEPAGPPPIRRPARDGWAQITGSGSGSGSGSAIHR